MELKTSTLRLYYADVELRNPEYSSVILYEELSYLKLSSLMTIFHILVLSFFYMYCIFLFCFPNDASKCNKNVIVFDNNLTMIYFLMIQSFIK